jgi:hypothetical protein
VCSRPTMVMPVPAVHVRSGSQHVHVHVQMQASSGADSPSRSPGISKSKLSVQSSPTAQMGPQPPSRPRPPSGPDDEGPGDELPVAVPEVSSESGKQFVAYLSWLQEALETGAPPCCQKALTRCGGKQLDLGQCFVAARRTASAHVL